MFSSFDGGFSKTVGHCIQGPVYFFPSAIQIVLGIGKKICLHRYPVRLQACCADAHKAHSLGQGEGFQQIQGGLINAIGRLNRLVQGPAAGVALEIGGFEDQADGAGPHAFTPEVACHGLGLAEQAMAQLIAVPGVPGQGGFCADGFCVAMRRNG